MEMYCVNPEQSQFHYVNECYIYTLVVFLDLSVIITDIASKTHDTCYLVDQNLNAFGLAIPSMESCSIEIFLNKIYTKLSQLS